MTVAVALTAVPLLAGCVNSERSFGASVGWYHEGYATTDVSLRVFRQPEDQVEKARAKFKAETLYVRFHAKFLT